MSSFVQDRAPSSGAVEGMVRPRVPLAAGRVDTLHWSAFGEPAAPPPDAPQAASARADLRHETEHLVLANHAWNRLAWDQEDQARRIDAPADEIAANKRAIDRYNPGRHAAIEALDESLLARSVPLRVEAWISSESAGSIIDRLSINALRIHHMARQACRESASASHRDGCRQRLAVMREQRRDLLQALQQLLDGLRDGHCGFRLYRQFKMYNDPGLNPYLDGQPPAPG